jgi:hypothetical protein
MISVGNPAASFAAGPRRRTLYLALIALLLAVGVATLSSRTPQAEAWGYGGCHSQSCLPGSGYYGNRYWDCGLLDRVNVCYISASNGAGTTNVNDALVAGWGWGSADYDGGGSTTVCTTTWNTSNGGVFSDCETNLARACYFSNCDDQDTYALVQGIQTDPSHTIYGHGMY